MKKGRSIRPAFVGLALGVAAAVVAAVVSTTQFVQSVESKTYDRRVRWTAQPVSPSTPIVIVEINESSVRALEPAVGRWPWPRLVHASAIDYLKRSGAKVIAYDVLLLEHEGRSSTVINGQTVSGAESDEALVTAVRTAGNVVLLADATYEGTTATPVATETERAIGLLKDVYQPGAGFQVRPNVAVPFRELADAAAAIGHNYLFKDAQSDAARRILPFVENRGLAVPSLGLAAALVFKEVPKADVRAEGSSMRVGDARMPILREPVAENGQASTQVLFRLRAPVPAADGSRSTYPTYSFFDLVLSEDNVQSGRPPVIPASAFEGKVVFIGTTASGLFDRYATPFDGGAAGVEFHATLADNVLTNSFMRRAPWAADIAVSLVAGLGAGLAATTLPLWLAIGVSVGLLLAIGAGLTWAVGTGVWLGAVMPIASLGLALFGGVSWRYLVEDRARRHVRELFGRYVSNDVIEQLMDDPALVSLGGQRREMTVLFSDIRGFTAASERATPEDVVAQLNEYFGAMVEVLFRHQGTLDKFVGDMVMGLFGAPLPDPRHADHAVETAVEMIQVLERMNVGWKAQGKPVLNIGIGINSGEMIAGNIGSEAIMSYTVIGDAVNLGSRLESLNKDYGTRILISEETRSRLTLDVQTRPIGAVTVKGRAEPVSVFEVAGLGAARRQE